ncbi:hypothetical protein ALC62_11029 [Cyphomyrmex costatus]|uniref:Uncharacterized protein n=1 Tax=Cyphomyrmex costatus TaxID=456900 RepID=A0A151ICX1_9HYME|nr:hypothetical protein ALC62_11029 [Cyphomyrmex costatus]
MSRSTGAHSLSQCSRNVSKNILQVSKKLPKLQTNKTYKTSAHRGLSYPIFPHRRGFLHRRGFHSSLFPFGKSDSKKPSACKKMDKICKPTEIKKTDECGKSCKEKSDVFHREKVKCDKSQRNKKTKQKPKIEKKIVDAECRKTCLPISKCELPRTVSPPKMEYAKVTCAPPKFAKPKPCPPVEHFHKDDTSDMKTKLTNGKKKQICTPLPLPKPPNTPIVLCPCPPPPKVHPGSCPCYETKAINKRPSTQPCLLKKKYSCPTGVHYCSPQKKPCNLRVKRETVGCEHRKKKTTSAS